MAIKKATAKKKAKKKPARPRGEHITADGTVSRQGEGGFVFPAGNKYWQCRAKHGRDGTWPDPRALLNDCLAYFEWLEINPLYEDKGFAYQGVVTHEPVAKMRAATVFGLCAHLGISQQTWGEYRKKPGFSEVCQYTDDMIREQKFVGAAADLLNPAIIARDLGLKDGVSAELSGPNGKPIEVADRTERVSRLAFLLGRGKSGGD